MIIVIIFIIICSLPILLVGFEMIDAEEERLNKHADFVSEMTKIKYK